MSLQTPSIMTLLDYQHNFKAKNARMY